MDALEVAVRLARALGLAPYTASTGTGCKRQTYTLNSTYRRVGFGVLLTFGVATSSVWLMNMYNSWHSGHAMLDLALKLTPSVPVAQTCAFLVLLWWRQNPLLLKALNSELFRSLPPLGLREAVLPLLVVATYMCGACVTIAYQFAKHITGPGVILTYALVEQVAKLLYLTLIEINMALFAFLLACIATHVDGVNDALKEMTLKPRKDDTMAVAEADIIATLRRKRRQAVLVTEDLSDAFGWLVALCFVVDVGWFVENAFVLIAWPLSSQWIFLVLFTGTARSVVCSALLTTVAHQLAVRTNRSTLLLVHVMRNSSCHLNAELRRELNAFSSQISQMPLLVSLGGVVKFNLPFFFQAFGAAVMCLVILLQFRQTLG